MDFKIPKFDELKDRLGIGEASSQAGSRASQATRPNRDFGALREDSHRSPGVNSLFEPSSAARPAASAPQAAASSTGAYAQTTGAIPASASPSGEGRVVQRPARIVTIVKPESYDDAERIAKVLKSGDVAVVSLRNTPEALGKRILDFSFGVACAFEAQVECVSGHVFVITRGAGLSDAEASRLKAQGLM